MLITTRKQLMKIAAWIKIGSQVHNIFDIKRTFYIYTIVCFSGVPTLRLFNNFFLAMHIFFEVILVLGLFF